MPDPYLWLTDPDADPGGPKTYGSGSGCVSGSPTLFELKKTESQNICVWLDWSVVYREEVVEGFTRSPGAPVPSMRDVYAFIAAFTYGTTLRWGLPQKGFQGGSHKKRKFHRRAYRFSKDFSLLCLFYGFLSKSPMSLFGNQKHLPKVLNFCFAVEIFKIHRQVWIFFRIFVCFETILQHYKYLINKH